ncbi:MAG: hypothetical protein HYY93_16270 [Planctomycetes bacterium]|nr:hypothetical protein [Planctomycetota bacterium]
MTIASPNLQQTMTNAEYALYVQNLLLMQDRTAQAAAAARTQDVEKLAQEQVPPPEAATDQRVREQEFRKEPYPRKRKRQARPAPASANPPGAPVPERPTEKGKGGIVDLDA